MIIKDLINQFPEKFSIISAKQGFFGSLVYRIIAGTDTKFVWKNNFCGTTIENLKPLEWPRKTEGFLTYEVSMELTFKENHFAAVHIGSKLLEKYENEKELARLYEKNKILLLKTHLLNSYKELRVKKYTRVYGSTTKIINPKITGFRRSDYIKPVSAKYVFNLNIENLMSDNYDIFFKEYLNLCNFYDMLPNTNNVRAFILLHKERLKRWSSSL